MAENELSQTETALISSTDQDALRYLTDAETAYPDRLRTYFFWLCVPDQSWYSRFAQNHTMRLVRAR